MLVAYENVVKGVGVVVESVVYRQYLSAGITEYRIGAFGYNSPNQSFGSVYGIFR